MANPYVLSHHVYSDIVQLLGLNKNVAEECQQLVIRLVVGELVQVEYHTYCEGRPSNGVQS